MQHKMGVPRVLLKFAGFSNIFLGFWKHIRLFGATLSVSAPKTNLAPSLTPLKHSCGRYKCVSCIRQLYIFFIFDLILWNLFYGEVRVNWLDWSILRLSPIELLSPLSWVNKLPSLTKIAQLKPNLVFY